MSQTIVPVAATGSAGGLPPDALTGPGGAQPSGSLSGRLRSAWTGLEHSLAGTPGRLRIVSGISVLAAVLIALGGGAALRERSAAIDEAKSAAAHLVLVQSVQINLAQADADATNSFLGFGTIEPQGPRLDYITSIQDASKALALAARGSAEDATVLGAANVQLTRYTGYIASARANRLEGKPVGANYLSTASSLLTDTVKVNKTSGIFEQLTARANADQKQIDGAYSRSTRAALWLVLVAVIGLGVLIWAQFFLARHSRRILNLPLAAATVGVLVALIVAGTAMVVSASKASDVRDGALAQAQDLSRSRVEAFTAKSQESLTLIQRGSATEDDEAWNGHISPARSALPAGQSGALQALEAYIAEHKKINTRDVAGDWTGAVQEAIQTTKTSANGLFQAYASQTDAALKTQNKATADGLGNAGGALLPAGILLVLLGLLAAVGAWWGVTLRLDEYR